MRISLRPEIRRRLTRHRALLPALFLAPLLAAGVWLCGDALLLRIWTPIQLNYVEGFNVDDASRLAKGQALYGNPTHPPYVVTVYTPGYAAAVAALIAAGAPGLPVARLVNFLSVVAIAALIAISGAARTRWIAVGAGLVFLLDPIQPFWQIVARPDGAATLLAIAGIAALEGRTSRGRDACAAALFAASILTKQSFLAAPAAALLVVWRCDRRRAWRLAALLGAAVAAAVFALQVGSHGEFFWQTVAGNANPFSWARVVALGGGFWSRHLPHLGFALAILLSGFRNRPWSATAMWAAIATVACTIMVGKAGTDFNYFIEPMAAVSLLVAREFPLRWLSRPALPAGLTAVALVGWAALVTATSLSEAAKTRHALALAQAPYRELMALVAGTPGIVVSDDACLLGHAGKSVHIQPFVMAGLSDAGRWNQEPFLAELESQQVRLIIAQVSPPEVFRSRYTSEMRRLVAGRYVQVARYGVGVEYGVFAPTTPH